MEFERCTYNHTYIITRVKALLFLSAVAIKLDEVSVLYIAVLNEETNTNDPGILSQPHPHHRQESFVSLE